MAFDTLRDNETMRKRIVFVGIGLLIVLVAWLGFRQLLTGRLVVTTNGSEAVISVYKLGEENINQPVSQATGNTLSARLPAGDYLIKVASKAFATSKAIHITARQTQHQDLRATAPKNLEPVLPAAVTSIVADTGSVRYLDSLTKNIYVLDASNTPRPLDSSHYFETVRWASTQVGIGRGSDGNLYVIGSSTISPLSLPFALSDGKSVLFAISADGHIFVTHGADIYVGTSPQSFKKIYTANVPAPSLASWQDRVAVLEAPGDIEGKGKEARLTVVNSAGKVLARGDAESGFVDWSPDGKYIVSLSDDLGGQVFDSSLHKASALPSLVINGLAWSGNTLYFSAGEQLWSLDVRAQTSQLVASLAQDSTLSDVATSSDGASLYLTVSKSGSEDGEGLYRLGLHNQKVPDYVYQLPVFLPDTSQSCSLSFVNFSRPTIIGRDSVDPNQTCPSAIRTVFAPYGIDTDLMSTSFMQLSPEE